MSIPTRLLFILVLMVAYATSETRFTVPGQLDDDGQDDTLIDYSKNPFYRVGDTVEAKWTSNYSRFDISVFQANPFVRLVIQELGIGRNSYQWTVDLNDTFGKLPPGEDFVFLFQVYPITGTDKEEFVMSTPFNVTGVNYEEEAPALSAGAGAGIAVAATLVFVLGLLVLAFCIWRKRKGLPLIPSWKKKSSNNHDNNDNDNDKEANTPHAHDEKSLEQNSVIKEETAMTPLSATIAPEESIQSTFQNSDLAAPAEPTPPAPVPQPRADVAELSTEPRSQPRSPPSPIFPANTFTLMIPRPDTVKGGELIGD